MAVLDCEFWVKLQMVRVDFCPSADIGDAGQPCNVYDWLNCKLVVPLNPFPPYDSVTTVEGYYMSFNGEFLVANVRGLIAGVDKQSVVVFKQTGNFDFTFYKYVLDPNSTEEKDSLRGANEDLTSLIIHGNNTAVVHIYNLIGGVYVQNTIDTTATGFPANEDDNYSFNRQLTLLATTTLDASGLPIFYFADITGEPGSEVILYDSNKTIDLSSDANLGAGGSPCTFTNNGKVLAVYPENLVAGFGNTAIILYDITDILAPVMLFKHDINSLAPGQTIPSQSGMYSLSSKIRWPDGSAILPLAMGTFNSGTNVIDVDDEYPASNITPTYNTWFSPLSFQMNDAVVLFAMEGNTYVAEINCP